MPNPRALKIVVIGMGIALLVGFAAVIVTVMYQIKHPKAEPLRPPRTLAANLAPGGRVEHVTLDGSRLALDLSDIDGRRIVVFDLQKGRATDVIQLGTAASGARDTP